MVGDAAISQIINVLSMDILYHIFNRYPSQNFLHQRHHVHDHHRSEHGYLSPECDVPVPGIPGTGNFSFLDAIASPSSYHPESVSQSVSESVSNVFRFLSQASQC